MRLRATAVIVAGFCLSCLASSGCTSESSTSSSPWAKPPASDAAADGNAAGSGGASGSAGAAASDSGVGGAKDGGSSGSAGNGGALIDAGSDAPASCTPGEEKPCYTGPAGTQDVGPCKAGLTKCGADGFTWGACTGQVLPVQDTCLDNEDNDCNGVLNDGNHTAPGCACTPGTKKCVNDKEVTCNVSGDWGPPGGPCCKAGQFTCECNQVLQCDEGPPPKWVPKTPALLCDMASRCDAATGTCKPLTTTGTTTPTGSYLQYAIFNSSGGVFKGGYDVDSEGNKIYVNRGGTNLDVYEVTLEDTDGDGLLEPNQHPDNANEPGPMEKRTLKFIETFSAVNDKAPMGNASQAEIFVTPDRVFSLGPTRNGDITEWPFATKTPKVVVHPKTSFALSQMGYSVGEGMWYGSNESHRRVYSFCPASQTWIAEFQYPDLAGSHMDGIEGILSFSTGVQYIYVSDMTSDYIGQYRRNSSGGWVQENLFKYADSTGSAVEGLGFGAFHHFWATGGSILYEIGGGDLTGYLQ